MQRVAIARAIVNDPEIILADEPTGALDTETSVEVMDILKELSRDRLVIMVTHNPQLAEEYSDRIVRIQDGLITSDSAPVDPARERLTPEQVQAHAVADARKGKRSMSFRQALALSFNNLMTKKGRTFLTAFAGSIGIIGIALILSLSSGTQDYIKETEESTMGSYPLTINQTSTDLTSVMGVLMGTSDERTGQNDSGGVQSKNIVSDMVSSMAEGSTENDMGAIKAWIDTDPAIGDSHLSDLVTDIQFTYATPLNVYRSDTTSGAVQVNPATVLDSLGIAMGETQTEMMSTMNGGSGSAYDVWTEMLANKETWERDYDVVAGRMPEAWNEVVIYVDENDRISDYTLYALGLLDQSELRGMMSDVIAGRKVEDSEQTSYTYDELMGLTFKLVPESSKYAQQQDGTWADMSDDADYMRGVVDDAEELRVVGIVRPSEENDTGSNWGAVLYTPELTEHLVEAVNASDVVAAQEANPNTDIFTGLPFEDTTVNLTMDAIEAMIDQMPSEQGAQLRSYVDGLREDGLSDEEIASAFSRQMSEQTDNATYDGNLETLGVCSLEEPSSISIYPIDFEAKEQIDALIDDYNEQIGASGEGTEIQYTDMVGMLMSSVTDIVNALTYILIAFVAISLVVSSIMIGIITYISGTGTHEGDRHLARNRGEQEGREPYLHGGDVHHRPRFGRAGHCGDSAVGYSGQHDHLPDYRCGEPGFCAGGRRSGACADLGGALVPGGARAEPHGCQERPGNRAAHGVAGAGRPVGCLPAAGCRRGARRGALISWNMQNRAVRRRQSGAGAASRPAFAPPWASTASCGGKAVAGQCAFEQK